MSQLGSWTCKRAKRTLGRRQIRMSQSRCHPVQRTQARPRGSGDANPRRHPAAVTLRASNPLADLAAPDRSGAGLGIVGGDEPVELVGGSVCHGVHAREFVVEATARRVETLIRLGIVDDDAMVRTGLTFILGGEADIEVARQAVDGAEELARLDTDDDVVLLDIRSPGMDGLATLEALGSRPRHPAVIVLTTFNTDDVVRALRLGAEGFLLKDAEPARLVEAIGRVHAGEHMLSPEVTRDRGGDGRRAGGRASGVHRSPCSPSANARWRCSWHRASPTPRSGRACTCPWRR